MSDQGFLDLINGLYIVAAILFILGLKYLGSPRTARKGNRLSALGMLIAIVATLVSRDIIEYEWIAIGIAIGAVIGIVIARTVKMTAMPQMVAVLNGFGGAASALVAAAELIRSVDLGDVPLDVAIIALFSTVLGALTLTGSLIAFGKLQGIVTSRAVLLPLRNVVNALILIAIIGLSAWLVVEPNQPEIFLAVGLLSVLLGVLLVIPIGGADMPVVISLLNSYSGIAAAAAGVVLQNNILIIAGALVGASGLILTRIMTKAMNRSLANVIFGGFGATATVADAAGTPGERPYRSATAEDVAMILGYSQSVMFVPGYGLAVAQAQHAVKELAGLLQDRGISVKYAIHPVAGRMPGHMNVLLAEADVPYEQLLDLDQSNPEFVRTDVAVVIGANDVTNPAARTDPESPIYGMPILDVDKARAVIVLKRSMATGFSGIDNDLFYLDNTSMFFGDAKSSVSDLVTELRQLD
ncbi:MAG: NAD(P)(+) transhydrogenase (Re/Si-specific) subunit beta [Chloroflexi bacterium]|nr:NAD(P)(+) transhydrogenase (Re/Si-specific) subunit beta [Chloroflexota bacterium]